MDIENTEDKGNNGAAIMIYARCAGDLAYKDGRKYVTEKMFGGAVRE